MVRLKQHAVKAKTIELVGSQFHYGSIKTPLGINNRANEAKCLNSTMVRLKRKYI